MILARIILAIAITTLGLGLVAKAEPSQPSLIFGQKQAYSAIVRSDGKVITYAKIILNNGDQTPLSKTSFTVPEGVDVNSLSVYQILMPEACVNPQPQTSADDRSTSAYRGSINCDDIERQAYQLDGYNRYYSSYYRERPQLRYQAVDIEQNGSTYNLTLPEPIKAMKHGAYLVSYIADKGYVSGFAGLYDLQFKTLQVPQYVDEVRVAVDVSTDLYTRAGRSSVQSTVPSGNSLQDGATSAQGAAPNETLDQLQGGIGDGGEFSKTGQGLAPGESFVVNGEFADAGWKLNIKMIVGLIVGAVLLIGAVILLLKKANQPTTGGKSRGSKK